MKRILRTFLYRLFALFATTQAITSFQLKGGLNSYIYTAAILGLLHLLVRPILKLVLFPVNLLTFGVFSWIINVIILFILVKITPYISIRPWVFPGISYGSLNLSSFDFNLWQTFVVISIFIGIIVNLLSWLSK
ncbi:phage holin family protein [Candidatus Gottesmanbacteria bacterium]|nr:phage holin family protein [Candidatus Gottesmanbacteria bacterium]